LVTATHFELSSSLLGTLGAYSQCTGTLIVEKQFGCNNPGVLTAADFPNCKKQTFCVIAY